jgi:tRNA pseudouridine55 synthase
MNGVIIVNKPKAMTSFDVVAILRKLTGIRKIGHTGTLDPDATGVLPLCLGRATGAVEYLTEKDKKYRVSMKLGNQTDTGDSSGKTIKVMDVNVSKDDIEEVVMSFKGRISQIPPMYSAIKINGEKLCNLARKGIVVERQPREIEIFSIDVLEIDQNNCTFDVHCSKGTYIRTLCEDIATKLGTCGHMSNLIRTSSGKFSLEDSYTIEQLRVFAQNGSLNEKMIKVDKVLDFFECIVLSKEEAKRFLNGAYIKLNKQKYSLKNSELLFRIYQDDLFLGLGSIIIKEDEFILKSKKLF